MSNKPYKPAPKSVVNQIEKVLAEGGSLPSGVRIDFSSRTPYQVPNPGYTGVAGSASDEDRADPSDTPALTPQQKSARTRRANAEANNASESERPTSPSEPTV